jgi:hypothetical protein
MSKNSNSGYFRKNYVTPRENRERGGPCWLLKLRQWGLVEYKWNWSYFTFMSTSSSNLGQAVVLGRLSLSLCLLSPRTQSQKMRMASVDDGKKICVDFCEGINYVEKVQAFFAVVFFGSSPPVCQIAWTCYTQMLFIIQCIRMIKSRKRKVVW